MPNIYDQANANAELIPHCIKKNLSREGFPGRSRIDSVMHTTMMPGAFLDRSLGDALFAIQSAKKDLLREVVNYANLQLTTKIAGMSPPACAPASAIAIIQFIKQVKAFIQELQELIQGLRDIALYLASIQQRIMASLQRILTSLATLINEICNFHLPALPSLPNLFGDLSFDGFKFTKGMFNFQLHFDTHFAFGNCKVRNIAGNPFQQALQNWENSAPVVVNPSGHVGASMTESYRALFAPPMPSGVILPAGADPSSSTFYVNGRWLPVFRDDFSPTTDFQGALPTPRVILSPYTMLAQELTNQVLSLLGDAKAVIADLNAEGLVGGPQGNATTHVDPALHETVWEPLFMAPTRAYCTERVSLAALEDASDDWASLTAPVVGKPPAWAVGWAWTVFMQQTRAHDVVVVDGCPTRPSVSGRGGLWVPTFQPVFEQFVADTLPVVVPWNAASAGLGELPVFSHLTALDEATRKQVLWALSYLEASLLGYTRTTRWDLYAPGRPLAPATPHPLVQGFLEGPTGSDLDYLPLPVPTDFTTVALTLDSGGKANYPTVMTVPDYLATVMRQVIGWANASILNNPVYTSQQARSMYVYTAQATAVMIDSYSQFWRDFAANWTDLNRREAGFVARTVNYPAILLDALNPRSTGSPNQGVGVAFDPSNSYQRLLTDWDTRTKPWLPAYDSRNTAAPEVNWAPGWRWLPTPRIPEMYFPLGTENPPPGAPSYGDLNPFGSPIYGLPQFADDPALDGWDRAPDPDDPSVAILSAFNRDVFLARTDIQALPFNERMALADLNQAFDDAINSGVDLLMNVESTITACEVDAVDTETKIQVLIGLTRMEGANPIMSPQDAAGNFIFDPNAFEGLAPVTPVPTGTMPDFSSNTIPPPVSFYTGEPTDGIVPPPPARPLPGSDPAGRLRHRRRILQMVPPPGTNPMIRSNFQD